MKLSIVIICWNDLEYILKCIGSVYAETQLVNFEIIVADNGSSDGSVRRIREMFPRVRIVENGENLGFGMGNNAGIALAEGEYILILNPDTIVHDRAIEKLVAYADGQPSAGAFGCRVLNTDGSLQRTAQPMPTLRGALITALHMRWLGWLSERFGTDTYVAWHGRTERAIGFQAGCCLLVRGKLLKSLRGFDERFFHQGEDADLCHRVWNSGHSVLFCPDAEVTHIGGWKRGGYPIKVVLETERSKYRYFQKHYGVKAAARIRYISLLDCCIKCVVCGLQRPFSRCRDLEDRLERYRVLLKWHWGLDPARFIESGEEPDLGYAALAHPANIASKVS